MPRPSRLWFRKKRRIGQFIKSWHLSIRSKTLLLIAIAVAALGGLAMTMLIDFRDRYALTRLTQAEAAINATLAMLHHQHELTVAGVLSLDQAQAAAKRLLRKIRYGDGEGYVAVLNDQFFNVVHPIHPEMDGADMSDLQDADGRFIAREAIAIGHQGGVGVNRYRFKNPETGSPDLKTSAITRFDPWGWTLIAGVFDRRVDQAIAEISRNVAVFLSLAVLVFLAVAALVAHSIVSPIRALTDVMSRIANGALNTPIPFTETQNEHGHIARALSVFRDNALRVNDLKTDLEEALRYERAASAQQRQFLSMVSHEFRTPLAIVDSAAGALQRRRARMSEEKIDKTLGDIRHAVLRLIRLMESTLTASKLEEGTIALNRVPFDLKGLLRQLALERQALSPHAKISIDVAGLPDRPNVDDRLMYSVFDNLLSNAIKYGGDRPEVSVRGWRDGGCAMVAVADSGVGIPHDEIDRIGERYFRASTANGVSGTGIGLNLVANVAEMHGGALTIDSTVGVGSTFTVALSLSESPCAAASKQAPVQPNAATARQTKQALRLLVYSSVATATLDDADLQALYDVSRRNNKAANVTGCLIYQDGRVVQALEGPADAIQRVFGKIASDPRHQDVVVRLDAEVAHRTFHEWLMGREAALRHVAKRPTLEAIFQQVLKHNRTGSPPLAAIVQCRTS